jgi:ubiquinone/menaquinone biosynthesis C-methylase UbiE
MVATQFPCAGYLISDHGRRGFVDTAQVKRNYDRLSRWYDILAGSSEKKYRNIGLQLLQPKPAEHILEIGFGTGHALLHIAKLVGEQGRTVGIDISEGMRQITERRISCSPFSSRIQLVIGSATELPLTSDTFDAVFMSFTLELFDSEALPQVLSECRRVLKSTGRITLVSMATPQQMTFINRLYAWGHKRFPHIIDCKPIPVTDLLIHHGFTVQRVLPMSLAGIPVVAVRANA